MKKAAFLILGIASVLAMGATFDLRGNSRFPVCRIECAQVSWDTGDGHAPQTTTAAINGIIYRIDIIFSSVTDNPTVTVSYEDQNGVVCLPNMTGLADGTAHFKNGLVNSLIASADFNPVAVAGDITVTIDPSADPGGSGQTLTADVIFYVR